MTIMAECLNDYSLILSDDDWSCKASWSYELCPCREGSTGHCLDCDIDICNKCEGEHRNHKIAVFMSEIERFKSPKRRSPSQDKIAMSERSEKPLCRSNSKSQTGGEYRNYIDEVNWMIQELDQTCREVEGKMLQMRQKIRRSEREKAKSLGEINEAKRIFIEQIGDYCRHLRKEIHRDSRNQLKYLVDTHHCFQSQLDACYSEKKKLLSSFRLSAGKCNDMVEMLSELQGKAESLVAGAEEVGEQLSDDDTLFVKADMSGTGLEQAARKIIGFLVPDKNPYVECESENMGPAMKQHAISCCRDAFNHFSSKPQNRETFTDLAEMVHSQFTKLYNRNLWSVTVSGYDCAGAVRSTVFRSAASVKVTIGDVVVWLTESFHSPTVAQQKSEPKCKMIRI